MKAHRLRKRATNEGSESVTARLRQRGVPGARPVRGHVVLDLAGSVLDTTDTRFTLDGQVRLRSEQLDLRLSAHPKDVSLFAARSPFIIDGSFRHPGFHPWWPGLAGRAAAAAALALIAPPAALLAAVEPGLGDTAPCATREK